MRLRREKESLITLDNFPSTVSEYTEPRRPSASGQKRFYIELFSIGHSMSFVKIYDVVKVKRLNRPVDFQSDGASRRAPVPGDVAAVIELYTNPPGYELECTGKDGITIWLHAFAPDDIELEVIG